MYEDGSSIDSFVRNKKQDAEKKKYCRAINRLLKEKYYDEYQQKNMKQQAIDQVKLFNIYLTVIEGDITGFERKIHTSLCNHSIVWVREFIEYGLTNLDSLGGIVCSLSELSHQMGIDFTQSPQHDTPVFNLC
jgi:hypothetical protein